MAKQEFAFTKAERRKEQAHSTDSGKCPEMLLSILEGRRPFSDYKRVVYLFWKSSSVEGYPWTCVPFQNYRLVWTDLSLHAALLDLSVGEAEEAVNDYDRFFATSEAGKLMARKGVTFLMHTLQGKWMAAFEDKMEVGLSPAIPFLR